MPFKIVQTIEDGEACLCVVPSKWEVNGTLHWPLKSQVAKLCQIENSVPNEKWEKINCVRKREFSTRNEAIKEMERMEKKSDTEIDDVTFNPIVKKTKTRSKLIQPHSSKPDFNSEIPVREDATEYPSAASSTGSNNKISTQFFLRNEAISPQILTTGNGTYLLREDEELQGISALETDGNTAEVFVLQHGVHDSEKESILTKLLENQHKIMQSIAKLQASVDLFAKEYKNGISTSKTAAETLKTSDACILTEPINSLEKLNEIEDQLKNESVINCVVENMKFICGNNGKANGIDCCYKLIDYFITREFLRQCSWTGNTRSTCESISCTVEEGTSSLDDGSAKVALKYFKNFRKCFLKTVMLADKDFTETQCDIFFKRIMKNSRQRVMGKILISKHKNRPKCLKYKKWRNTSTNNEEGQEESIPNIEMDQKGRDDTKGTTRD